MYIEMSNNNNTNLLLEILNPNFLSPWIFPQSFSSRAKVAKKATKLTPISEFPSWILLTDFSFSLCLSSETPSTILRKQFHQIQSPFLFSKLFFSNKNFSHRRMNECGWLVLPFFILSSYHWIYVHQSSKQSVEQKNLSFVKTMSTRGWKEPQNDKHRLRRSLIGT